MTKSSGSTEPEITELTPPQLEALATLGAVGKTMLKLAWRQAETEMEAIQLRMVVVPADLEAVVGAVARDVVQGVDMLAALRNARQRYIAGDLFR